MRFPDVRRIAKITPKMDFGYKLSFDGDSVEVEYPPHYRFIPAIEKTQISEKDTRLLLTRIPGNPVPTYDHRNGILAYVHDDPPSIAEPCLKRFGYTPYFIEVYLNAYSHEYSYISIDANGGEIQQLKNPEKFDPRDEWPDQWHDICDESIRSN
jgi:hypothetical protein